MTKAVFMNKMQVCEASFAINKSVTIPCWWCMLSSELPVWIRTKDVSSLVSCLQQWPPTDGVKERNYTVMSFFSRNFFGFELMVSFSLYTPLWLWVPCFNNVLCGEDDLLFVSDLFIQELLLFSKMKSNPLPVSF